MMFPLEDTITAIASAHALHGLRGVVRLSGPSSFSALQNIGIPLRKELFDSENHQTSNSAFHFETEVPVNGIGTKTLIPARVYCWPNGRSYTGQEAAEIHTLGVLPFLETLLETLCRTGCVRMAQPGEFTLRAFLSGRLDLTQAEAVLGTIDAQSPKKLQTALHQLSGGLAVPMQGLRNRLFDLLGQMEAGFDFADEDIEFISSEEIAQQLRTSGSEIDLVLQKMKSRSGSATTPRAVLYGAPNIGKSALFNTLTGSENALVFDCPGTTRDYLSAPLELGSWSCLLVDTAGDFQRRRASEPSEPVNFTKSDSLISASPLNETSQQLARDQRELADIPLFCFDAEDFLRTRREALPLLEAQTNGDALLLLMRCDRVSSEALSAFISELPTTLTKRLLSTSSRTGLGLATLKTRLEGLLAERAGDESDIVASTQSRCKDSLQTARESLRRAETLCGSGFQELIAAEVRTALDQIGLMVGAVYSEDILDSIFSRFCVGK